MGSQHRDVFMAGKAGVCVLVHKQLRKNIEFDKIIIGRNEAEGRFVAVPIRTLTSEQRIWICSIYAPVLQRKERHSSMWHCQTV